MKRSYLFKILLLGLFLAVGAAGCKKHPIGPTPIGMGQKPTSPGPGPRVDIPPGNDNVPPVLRGPGVDATQLPTDAGKEGIATAADLALIQGMIPDREHFRSETVYFDFDRAAVKASEKGKVETVANYFKQHASEKLQIEGHCDERGTEEYNRALGERRALAIREYLVNLGVAADRVYTLSWGEDKPADSGHDDAAWGKNRRGEFILLKP
ncbi:MAG: OmpA family protein, partial [Verrucomicrobiota bacterium]